MPRKAVFIISLSWKCLDCYVVVKIARLSNVQFHFWGDFNFPRPSKASFTLLRTKRRFSKRIFKVDIYTKGGFWKCCGSVRTRKNGYKQKHSNCNNKIQFSFLANSMLNLKKTKPCETESSKNLAVFLFKLLLEIDQFFGLNSR